MGKQKKGEKKEVKGDVGRVIIGCGGVFFFFKQKTAYEIGQ